MPRQHTTTATAIRPLPKAEEKPTPIREKRRCQHPGCISYLNQWHDSTLCYAHEAKRSDDRYRWVATTEHLRELMSEAA